MARLLYINSSPKKGRSNSGRIAEAFIETYRQTHKEDLIESLHLWDITLPDVDEDIINIHKSIVRNESVKPAGQAKWQTAEKIILEFINADKYLFTVPMWNFSVPYKLKHYIDLVVAEKYSYDVINKQSKGNLAQKPACVIYSRSQSYPRDNDFQAGYMQKILQFVGIRRIESVFLEPSQGCDREQLLENARREARAIAKKF